MRGPERKAILLLQFGSWNRLPRRTTRSPRADSMWAIQARRCARSEGLSRTSTSAENAGSGASASATGGTDAGFRAATYFTIEDRGATEWWPCVRYGSWPTTNVSTHKVAPPLLILTYRWGTRRGQCIPGLRSALAARAGGRMRLQYRRVQWRGDPTLRAICAVSAFVLSDSCQTDGVS